MSTVTLFAVKFARINFSFYWVFFSGVQDSYSSSARVLYSCSLFVPPLSSLSCREGWSSPLSLSSLLCCVSVRRSDKHPPDWQADRTTVCCSFFVPLSFSLPSLLPLFSFLLFFILLPRPASLSPLTLLLFPAPSLPSPVDLHPTSST